MGKIVYNGREYLSAGTASTMQGATSTTDGVSGLVPQPLIADREKFLKGDGTWGTASEVEANPSGTATDTLQTVDIDGTIYEIQGGGGGGSNLIVDAQIYSFEEKQVGVWIDNKPLYQKTTYFGAISSGANYGLTMDIGANIVDTVIDMFANAKVSSGAWVVLPYPLPSANYAAYLDGYNKSTDKLTIKTGNDRSFVEGYATIYYTKTTDAAGSGGYQAYGFSPIIYSETEREVGVWVNNKPLYQKSINIGVLTRDSSFHYVAHNIANIDEIVDVNGVYQRDDGSTYSLNLMRPTTTNAIMLGADATNIQYMNTQQDDARYKAAWVTLYYTKTTDVAGSGSYNTLGVSMVHYLTDEQVIGTWIDGKTLYQKTWELSSVLSVASNTWVDTSILKQGIDAIMYINGANAEGAVFSFLGARAQTSTTNYVQIQQTRNSAITLKYITLQYTKTTD